MTFNPVDPGIDYSLRWPRSLLESEGRVVLRQSDDTDMAQEAELLLEDAFGSDEPRRDFATSAQRLFPFDSAAAELVRKYVEDPRRRFLSQVVSAAHQLPEEASPRPYYAARTGDAPAPDPWLTFRQPAQNAWRTAVRKLQDRGYFDQAAPWLGEDRHRSSDGQDALLDRIVHDRLGDSQLWWSTSPSRGDFWSEAQFFSMVEVFHDLVARPRRKTKTAEGESRYAGFAVEPGRALYAWTVNRLLERYGVDLRLAEEGEDIGRLVHFPADPRRELLGQVRVGVVDGNEHRIGHAIALYRDRQATGDGKRRACRELADVLESRRKTVLEGQLFKGDEGPLFEIANRFAIRHHRDDQMYAYDEAFLDWIFWWYLATVELTNQLIARDESTL